MTFFRDGHVEVVKKEADFAGVGGGGWGGEGGFAGLDGDEVEVGFVGGAAALSWRLVRAVLGVMVWH